MVIGAVNHNERFGQQHPRNANKSNQQESQLDLVLVGVSVCPPHRLSSTTILRHAQLEGQVDHSGDDTGRISSIETPVDSPLQHNQEIHVAEEKDQEDELRNELKEEIHHLAEVDCIGGLDENS